MWRSVRRKIAFGSVLAATCFGSFAFADDAPWLEKVIKQNVDETQYSGALSSEQLLELMAAGERLFTGKFTREDGAGRPKATQAILPTKRKHPTRSNFLRLSGPDASACSSCHNDPIIGGAGDVTANVFVSEGFTNPDFDTTDPQFSNERNTNHLMGAGLVELLAREMTRDLIELRSKGLKQAREQGEPITVQLQTKGVQFGKLIAYPDGLIDLEKVEGVDSDLNIRPFSQKGVFTSLRQFSVNAMNHHHGMQANERFGARWTGEEDFDEDGKTNELTRGDISALVAWQATLKAPEILQPENEKWRIAAKSGEVLFTKIGCASCHVSALPLESTIFVDPSPYDVAGTLRAADVKNAISFDLGQFDWIENLPRNAAGHLMIPLFSDLKRHKISDQKTTTFGNELLAQRFVERDQFQTSELWGIASTAPYGHRGDITTLHDTILAHGGEGATSKSAYQALAQEERTALIAFLKTLVIEK